MKQHSRKREHSMVVKTRSRNKRIGGRGDARMRWWSRSESIKGQRRTVALDLLDLAYASAVAPRSHRENIRGSGSGNILDLGLPGTSRALHLRNRDGS